MSLRRRTDAYWQKRAEQRLLASERVTKKHMAQMAHIYAEARRRTVKSLQGMYAAYYKKDEGFDMQALRSIVPTGEIKQFLKEMKRLGLNTSLPENYNGRVSRLKLINAQLEAEAKRIATQQEEIDRKALTQDFIDSYYRAGFDVAKGLGSTPITFAGLDEQTMRQTLNAKFYGENFSQRIWKNSDLLASRLKQTLSVAIANGQGIGKTAAEVARDFNVNRSYAERLIRTESNHFHNEGELEAYKQMGFEEFRFLATLDNRTSEICRDMDNKVFKVEDGVPGENVPPLHPNCRSTIVPVFKGYEPETRLYRDPETGKNGFTYNVPFNEWKAQLPVTEKPKKAAKKKESVIDENGNVKPGFYQLTNGKVVEVTREFSSPSYSIHNEKQQVAYDIDSSRGAYSERFIDDIVKKHYANGDIKRLDLTEEELVANLDKYLDEGHTFRGVTRHEEQLLSAYTHASAPNEGLRKGEKIEDVPMAKEVKGVMDRTVAIKGTFYRGLNDAEGAKSILGMKVGDVYSDKGFMSTDWNKSLAMEKFSDGGVVLEVTNKSTKPGINLSLAPYTHEFDENEVIFAPGTKMKITGIEKQGSKTVYKLEVMVDES